MAHAGQRGLDGDLHVLSQLLDQVRRQGNPHASAERPLHFHEVQIDHIAGIQSGDPHRTADADSLAIAKDDVDRPLRGEEAGAVARQADQADQAGHGHDHDQTDPDLADLGAGAHLDSSRGPSPSMEVAACAPHRPGGFSSVGP